MHIKGVMEEGDVEEVLMEVGVPVVAIARHPSSTVPSFLLIHTHLIRSSSSNLSTPGPGLIFPSSTKPFNETLTFGGGGDKGLC